MNDQFAARLKKRYAAERRFRMVGMLAVAFSALVLAFLLWTMTSNAVGGFKRAELRFEVDLSGGALSLDAAQLAGPNAVSALEGAGLKDVVQFSAAKAGFLLSQE